MLTTFINILAAKDLGGHQTVAKSDSPTPPLLEFLRSSVQRTSTWKSLSQTLSSSTTTILCSGSRCLSLSRTVRAFSVLLNSGLEGEVQLVWPQLESTGEPSVVDTLDMRQAQHLCLLPEERKKVKVLGDIRIEGWQGCSSSSLTDCRSTPRLYQ